MNKSRLEVLDEVADALIAVLCVVGGLSALFIGLATLFGINMPAPGDAVIWIGIGFGAMAYGGQLVDRHEKKERTEEALDR